MIRSLVVDSREPEWCKSLRFQGDIIAIASLLPVGDAWLACDDAAIVVERKTLSDLCASVADGRLMNQAQEMRGSSEWCYIVVTDIPAVAGGNLVINGKASGWKWSSIQGALLTCQELGVPVIWCDGQARYGATLEWLATRDRGGVRIAARREAVLESLAEKLLTAIPGIGGQRAAALLQYCGNAAWALDYLTGMVGGEVVGVGKNTMVATRSVLGLEDGNKLAVVSMEETNEKSE